ncbi:MAG: hypothetical protein IJP84_01500 [Lachnospiraceae bacterium]|nr:hypothetical protein [Lachnospiraceae bacterium]
MITQTISVISVSIQIAVLATLLGLLVKLIGESARNLTAVFLSFSFSLWLLTDLYWLIYDLMRPESRMPFAANEIEEVCLFLMIAATVNSANRRQMRLPMGYLIGTCLFAVSNAVLWILWSGEIVEDIIVGAVFVWLFYSIVCGLQWSKALESREWVVLGIVCAALIVCQGLTFILPENVRNIPDLCAYILMIAGAAFFTYLFIRAYGNSLAYPRLFLSCALVIWILTSKYMSGGNWYNLFLTLETPGIILWYMSVRKAVKAE